MITWPVGITQLGANPANGLQYRVQKQNGLPTRKVNVSAAEELQVRNGDNWAPAGITPEITAWMSKRAKELGFWSEMDTEVIADLKYVLQFLNPGNQAYVHCAISKIEEIEKERNELKAMIARFLKHRLILEEITKDLNEGQLLPQSGIYHRDEMRKALREMAEVAKIEEKK